MPGHCTLRTFSPAPRCRTLSEAQSRTDPLVHRRRRGSDEADCGADGRWPGDLIPDGTDRLSGALRAVEIPHVAAGVAHHSRVVPWGRTIRVHRRPAW